MYNTTTSSVVVKADFNVYNLEFSPTKVIQLKKIWELSQQAQNIYLREREDKSHSLQTLIGIKLN